MDPTFTNTTEAARERQEKGFAHLLDITFPTVEKDHVEGIMPITPDLYQPFGFVHGGATIALLETVASMGSEVFCDLEVEQPFGVEVTIRHKRSAQFGSLRGVAKLEDNKPSSKAGYKLFWHVAAYDDQDNVISEGTIVCKVVSKEYLAQKQAERAAE